MIGKIKKVGFVPLFVFFVLLVFGGFTSYITTKEAFNNIMDSETGKMEQVKDSVLNFNMYYESNAPKGKYINQSVYLLTGVCNSDRVIIGDENWFFYSATDDGKPIADYEGTNSYSEQEMDDTLDTVLDTQNTLKEKGIEFCLLVPPNKESVYSRYMPKQYQKAEQTRTDKLLGYLSENGVNAVNPKEELIKLSENYRTYYKYDSHWNELGANVGTWLSLDKMGLPYSEITEEMIEEDTKAKSDLITLSGLEGIFEPENGMTTSRTRHDIDLEDNELVHYTNDEAETDKTVFVVGDSFRTAMAPNLSYTFKDVYLVHRDRYSTDMIDTIDPDYLILEFVERYSYKISSFKLL